MEATSLPPCLCGNSLCCICSRGLSLFLPAAGVGNQGCKDAPCQRSGSCCCLIVHGFTAQLAFGR